MALSNQPYKGARDFYPEDKRLQKCMFNKWRAAVESFGYEEYDAPILEPLEIYLAKTGEEIVNEQTYVFEDRGGRQVVIRPEMTPTVSRLVAAKRQELTYPLRLYSIPNLWRYERPQRGRLREHWQLNADLFGVDTTNAELEMISLINAIFEEFGATSEMYQIRLNHRGLIDNILKNYLKLTENSIYSLSKLIDRMHKIERPIFISKLDEALTPQERERGATEKLLEILDVKSLEALPKELTSNTAYQELAKLLNVLHAEGLEHVIYDATLMRGFDYYTGIVFEAFDNDPANIRSMMGGGRYDALVGLFGVPPVPTVGFGWGDVTLANFLDTHHLLPDLPPETDLYVALIGDVYPQSQSYINELRRAGVDVAVDLSGKRLGDQLKAADKKRVRLVLIIGEDELRTEKFKLKDLKNGKEELLEMKLLISKIKEIS